MKVTRKSSFANTAIVGNVTYRNVGTYGVTILVSFFLLKTPIFRWNIPAMIAFFALASIIIGQTPTKRTILLNIYGLVFKKPIRQVVSEDTTTNTLGHGIKEVIDDPNVNNIMFRMYTKHNALVYNVTSNINRWSTGKDYEEQANAMKRLFNILEGGETLQLVTKSDADTGMLQLEKELKKNENFEGDDLQKLADHRRYLLHTVATEDLGVSVQQYAILKVKPANVHRCVSMLAETSRIFRPATNPGDVILSAMGLEAGTEQREDGDKNGTV